MSSSFPKRISTNMMGNAMAEFLFYFVHHQTSIENNAYKNNKHVSLQYFNIHRKLNELAKTELNFKRVKVKIKMRLK